MGSTRNFLGIYYLKSEKKGNLHVTFQFQPRHPAHSFWDHLDKMIQVAFPKGLLKKRPIETPLKDEGTEFRRTMQNELTATRPLALLPGRVLHKISKFLLSEWKTKKKARKAVGGFY